MWRPRIVQLNRSSKSVVELFYDYGILVNPKVKKDVFSGIQRVKSYFKDAAAKQ